MLSLEQTLQGAAPGVMVTQASSAPGGALSIRVRGGSSVTGNNEPLYVIDGFPIENDPDVAEPERRRARRDDDGSVESAGRAQPERHRVDRDSEGRVGDVDLRRARRERRHHHHDEARPDGARPMFTLDTYSGSAERRAPLRPAQRRRQFANSPTTGRRTTARASSSPTRITLPNTDWQSLIFRSAPLRNVQLGVTGGGRRRERDALRALRRRVPAAGRRHQLGVQAHLAARQPRSGHRRARARVASTVTVSRVNIELGSDRRLAQCRRGRGGRGDRLLPDPSGAPAERRVHADGPEQPGRRCCSRRTSRIRCRWPTT